MSADQDVQPRMSDKEILKRWGIALGLVVIGVGASSILARNHNCLPPEVSNPPKINFSVDEIDNSVIAVVTGAGDEISLEQLIDCAVSALDSDDLDNNPDTTTIKDALERLDVLPQVKKYMELNHTIDEDQYGEKVTMRLPSDHYFDVFLEQREAEWKKQREDALALAGAIAGATVVAAGAVFGTRNFLQGRARRQEDHVAAVESTRKKVHKSSVKRDATALMRNAGKLDRLTSAVLGNDASEEAKVRFQELWGDSNGREKELLRRMLADTNYEEGGTVEGVMSAFERVRNSKRGI